MAVSNGEFQKQKVDRDPLLIVFYNLEKRHTRLARLCIGLFLITLVTVLLAVAAFASSNDSRARLAVAEAAVAEARADAAAVKAEVAALDNMQQDRSIVTNCESINGLIDSLRMFLAMVNPERLPDFDRTTTRKDCPALVEDEHGVALTP